MNLNTVTRTGKIARLPLSIRDQLNRRILDNEPGPSLLDWLNSLPEVQAVLAADFASQPISPSNLSHWKAGGHRDWLTRLDALTLARELQDPHALGHDALAGPFADKFARWLSLRYASAAIRAFAAEDLDPDAHWRFLRQFQPISTNLSQFEPLAPPLALRLHESALPAARRDSVFILLPSAFSLPHQSPSRICRARQTCDAPKSLPQIKILFPSA